MVGSDPETSCNIAEWVPLSTTWTFVLSL